MRSVKNADNGLWCDAGTRPYPRGIDCFPDPVLTLAVAFTEVTDRLASPNMLMPDLVGKLLRPAFALKLDATISASVVLYAPSRSVLFCASLTACRAFF